MRLSESLSRNIILSFPGNILNTFKLKKRRSVYFFEDIFANYVKDAENRGYGKKLEKVGFKWGLLGVQKLVPSFVNMLPTGVYINLIGRKIWTNIGLLDDITLEKNNGTMVLKTKNEFVTRIVSNNKFMAAFYRGVLTGLRNNIVDASESIQSKDRCEYVFNETEKPVPLLAGKEKSEYNRLNQIKPIEGITLKDAIKKNIFAVRGNRIYFRNMQMAVTENTVFHLMGRSGMDMECIKDISYNYFSDIVDKDSSNDMKLTMLKNILQSMGWGIVNIILEENKIIVNIRNPPYGIQAENDNWDFLAYTILGYLKLINKGILLAESLHESGMLRITYEK